MYNKIIVVSDSDNCRGPMAKAILQELFQKTGKEVASRGMVVLFPEPVNQKCEAVCKAKGYDLSKHRSRPLCENDFGDDVMVFVMSDKQKLQIYEQFKAAVNVHSMKDFIGESGDMGDPYGMELVDYAAFFDKLKHVLEQVKEKLETLENEQKGEETL